MMERIADLLSLLQEAATAPRLDFLDLSLNDEDYLAWTGWIKQQFVHIYDIISPHLCSFSNLHIRNTLAVFGLS